MFWMILEVLVVIIATYLAMAAASLVQVVLTGIPLLALYWIWQGYRRVKLAILARIDSSLD